MESRLVLSILLADFKIIFERDPAARNWLEVLFCYPGLQALLCHRFDHWPYQIGFPFIPPLFSNLSRFLPLTQSPSGPHMSEDGEGRKLPTTPPPSAGPCGTMKSTRSRPIPPRPIGRTSIRCAVGRCVLPESKTSLCCLPASEPASSGAFGLPTS